MDCIFCRIVAGEIPAKKRFENDDCIIIEDISPMAPAHLLVIPKQHYASMAEAASDPALLGALYAGAADFAKDIGLESYRLVANTGPDAGQTVFHLHIHILGGKKLGGFA
ncbi:MAG: histidine triad nucleotide-binding protein [Clostridia bacterium]|nr:histidine triad nucleotide-binding protein [Clostridia bacterium]